MIRGVGTDVVSIERVQAALERFGDRFVNRILTPEERARFHGTRQKASHLAKRFAAKEAFSKAIGTGFHAPFAWHAVSVGNATRRLSFFVMVLAYSRLMYLEFTVSQTMEFFLNAHINAFEYFGARVPAKIMVAPYC